MKIEKLRKLVKDNGLKLRLSGVYDVSAKCGDSNCIASCSGRACKGLECKGDSCSGNGY